MKNKKEAMVFLSVLSVFLFSVATITKATVPLPTSADALKDKKNEIIAKHCNLATSKINLIIARYDNNKQKHIEKYQKIKERMKATNQILKSKGCDTNQAEIDYQKLDSMIIEFTKEYNALIGYLKNTQNYVCGQSQGDYIKSLNQARNQLIIVRQVSLNIRNFYQLTIRQNLLKIKEQCKNVPTPTSTQ